MSKFTYGAVILAAGEGSRLASAGVPRFFKPLLQVDGKFLVEHSIDFAKNWGVHQTVIVSSPTLQPLLKHMFQTERQLPWPTLSVQEKPSGVFDAIRKSRVQISSVVDYLIIMCADNTYGQRSASSMRDDFEKITDDHDKSAVTVRYFEDAPTRARLSGYLDGRLYERGKCDDAASWIGPLILSRRRFDSYLGMVTDDDVYDTQLLERHLTTIGSEELLALYGDCADWGVISNGKENIFV